MPTLKLNSQTQQFAKENTWKLLRNVNIYPVKAKDVAAVQKKIVCSPAKKTKKKKVKKKKIG